MNISKNTTVGELAANVPGAVRLFEKLSIDYCCGGKRPLEEVCMEKKLGADEVVAALETISDVNRGASAEKDWTKASLTELGRFIVEKHHLYVRNETPRIHALLDKICQVHGENRPEFLQVREYWTALAQELSQHMRKEELILFPYIEALDAWAEGSTAKPHAPFGSVRNPIQMMIQEHDSAGELIGQITESLTDRSGCNTTLEFFRSIDDFESDLHRHIHLENNVLFPRAEELESSPIEVGR